MPRAKGGGGGVGGKGQGGQVGLHFLHKIMFFHKKKSNFFCRAQMRKRDAAAADGGRMKELNKELDQVMSTAVPSPLKNHK